MKALYSNLNLYYLPSYKKFTFDRNEARQDQYGIHLDDVMIFTDDYDYHVENDGIGPYEFWGAQGYDRGHDYGVIDSIDDVCVEEFAPYLMSEDEDNSVYLDTDEDLMKYTGMTYDEFMEQLESYLNTEDKLSMFDDSFELDDDR